MLQRAGDGTVFASGALSWTNIAIGAIAGGAVVLASLFVYVTFADIPSPADGMEASACGWVPPSARSRPIGVALLVVIGRQWLGRAIAQRAELEQIV